MNQTYTDTPHEQLIALLDQIGLQKIVFQYGISLQGNEQSPRRDVLYIANTRLGYTTCIQVEKDNIMRPLARLSDAEIESIMQRVRVDYADKLKSK
jgi:hypothetical protein